MMTILRNLVQDVRYAVRQLRRAPVFAMTVALTLALGIGSATAVFSVLDATLLRPLPFANQDRLVFPDTQAINGWNQPWSYPSYLDARSQLSSFAALAGYTDYSKINLEAPSGPVSLAAVKGTDNFFEVFGIKPLLGRTYLPGEDQPGKDDVAVLSYEVWQESFGGQPDAVGKAVRLDGVPYTVIGVMPAGFRFPLGKLHAIYTPLHPDPSYVHNRGSHWMRSVGLVKAGVSREQAQADIRRVFANLARVNPADEGRTVSLLPLQQAVSGGVSAPLKTLALAVLALLAIACVNVAGLLLARGVRREREMALRAAVGAGRARLMRQIVTESLVLAGAGLGFGVGLAHLILSAMRVFLVASLARGLDVHLNLAALVAAVVLSGVVSVAAGIVPALRLSGADPIRAMREGGAASGRGCAQRRLRGGFAMIQVALSLALLAVSGLLLQHLRGLMTTKLGYPPEKVLTVHIDLSPGRYINRDPLAELYQPLLDRVSHLPGVQSAGMIDVLPIEQWGRNQGVHITGQPPYGLRDERWVENRFVTAGYFDAMGIRLLHGRMLSPALDPYQDPAGTLVVNQAFKRMFFAGGGDPVGAHIDDSDKAELRTGIVGMVTDTRQHLSEPPMPEMDLLADELAPKDRLGSLGSMTLVVRTSGDASPLISPIRAALHDLDPTIPFRAPETMAEVIAESLVFERFEGWLFGIFAGLALLLSMVGIHGMVHHEVEVRTREIGVRMALGSSRGRVVGDILRRVAVLMVAGVVAGWTLTLALRKVIASVVEMNAAHDALLLAGLTFALVAIGMLASLRPARNAASIDPMEALRNE
jgi:predicted permease